ncbi:UNVERIFIED_CONTAM: Expansin-A16 [Sesamum latifolium]|uniref:Expansin n=1 Tax=Sesamum latifolium TaxID=2727402 RepID=A0AAW2TZ16_9LAMI
MPSVESQNLASGEMLMPLSMEKPMPPDYGPVTPVNGAIRHASISTWLTQHSFRIAQYKAGIVPVQYRRVACKKKGGIKFRVNGRRDLTVVLVWNVGGAGDVESVWVKGEKNVKLWRKMKRKLGQSWEIDGVVLAGESLSFRVQTSDGRTSTSMRVAPNNWRFGQTFQGTNFK